MRATRAGVTNTVFAPSAARPLRHAADLDRPGVQRRRSPSTFKQVIKANDALRTGTYSKALTFTLSTTTP